MSRIIKLCLMVSLLVVMTVGVCPAKTLVVGCDTNFMPFEFKGADGKYTGFDIDLWDAIAKDLGLQYKLQPMDFNGLIPALQSANIDAAIAGMTIKSKREEVVDFAYPYYDAGLLLMVRSDNKDINGIEDLANKGMQIRNGLVNIFQDYGVAAQVTGEASFFKIHSKPGKIFDYRSAVEQTNRNLEKAIFLYLINRGINISSTIKGVTSSPMTSTEINALLNTVEDLLKSVRS